MNTFINNIVNEIGKESNNMEIYGKYYELGYAVGSVHLLELLKISIDNDDTYEKVVEQILSNEKGNNYVRRIYEENIKVKTSLDEQNFE